MKKLSIALVLTLSCVGLTALAQGEGGFQGGLDIAQGASGGGQLVFARVEGSTNTPQFGYYFLIEGRLVELEIKGTEIVKNKEIKEIPDKGPVNKKLIDALKVRTKTKLPNARYIEIALDKTKGTKVLSFTLIPVGDDIHVDVRTDGGNVIMDLTDGKHIRR